MFSFQRFLPFVTQRNNWQSATSGWWRFWRCTITVISESVSCSKNAELRIKIVAFWQVTWYRPSIKRSFRYPIIFTRKKIASYRKYSGWFSSATQDESMFGMTRTQRIIAFFMCIIGAIFCFSTVSHSLSPLSYIRIRNILEAIRRMNPTHYVLKMWIPLTGVLHLLAPNTLFYPPSLHERSGCLTRDVVGRRSSFFALSPQTMVVDSLNPAYIRNERKPHVFQAAVLIPVILVSTRKFAALNTLGSVLMLTRCPKNIGHLAMWLLAVLLSCSVRSPT